MCVRERALFHSQGSETDGKRNKSPESGGKTLVSVNFFFFFFFPLCDKTIAAVRPHMCRVLICALWFASSSLLIGVVLFTLPVRQCFQRAIAFNCDVPSYSVSAPQRHRSAIAALLIMKESQSCSSRM